MKRLAMMAAALAALALAATAVRAQCTVGDIQMAKTFPMGNLSRSDTSRTSTLVTFTLPSTCKIADPPLKACVNVWDTGNPEEIPVGSGDVAGPVIRPANGWDSGGFHMVCNPFFLAADIQTPPQPQDTLSLLIDFHNPSAEPSPNPPDYLILTMYNPTRYLRIPIDP